MFKPTLDPSRNASLWRFVPECLRKPIATCDFPGVGGDTDPLPPSGSADVQSIENPSVPLVNTDMLEKMIPWLPCSS